MDSEDIQGSGYWKIKLVFRLVMLVGLIIIWWGFGELVADYIIWSGIEWVRVSSVGAIVIGFGIVISTAIVDRMVERLYGFYDESSKNPKGTNSPRDWQVTEARNCPTVDSPNHNRDIWLDVHCASLS